MSSKEERVPTTIWNAHKETQYRYELDGKEWHLINIGRIECHDCGTDKAPSWTLHTDDPWGTASRRVIYICDYCSQCRFRAAAAQKQ